HSPVNSCGNLMGRMTASLSDSLAASSPATSSHFTLGFSVIIAPTPTTSLLLHSASFTCVQHCRLPTCQPRPQCLLFRILLLVFLGCVAPLGTTPTATATTTIPTRSIITTTVIITIITTTTTTSTSPATVSPTLSPGRPTTTTTTSTRLVRVVRPRHP